MSNSPTTQTAERQAECEEEEGMSQDQNQPSELCAPDKISAPFVKEVIDAMGGINLRPVSANAIYRCLLWGLDQYVNRTREMERIMDVVQNVLVEIS